MKKMFLATLCGLSIVSAFFFTTDTKPETTVAGNGGYVNVKI